MSLIARSDIVDFLKENKEELRRDALIYYTDEHEDRLMECFACSAIWLYIKKLQEEQ